MRQRLWVAVLATGGVLAFDTAAALWRLDDRFGEDGLGVVHVVVAPCRRVRPPEGVRVHRVFLPDAEVARHDGLPVTSRRWTVIDQLGRLPHGAGVRLADRALQQRWVTHEDLTERLATLPGRSGNAALQAVADRVGDRAAARSERLLHAILRRAGITGWVANLPVRLGGTLVGIVDVGFAGLRLALEVDGHAFHHDVDRFRHDRRRQNALVAAGWTVLRFTWADLVERPDEVATLVLSQIVERSAG